MAEQGLQVHGEIWLSVDGQRFGGRNRLDLLAAIADCGSITRAAQAVGLSYKAAWDAIETMNNLAGQPLVERLAGGKGGGGTRLTQRGQQLVANFRQIEAAHQQFVQQLSRQTAGMADDYLLLRRLALQTSARNQFAANVISLQADGVNVRVRLALAGGQTLHADITAESAAQLGLCEGMALFALLKAPAVRLLPEEAVVAAGGNVLAGQISRVQHAANNSEVVLALGDGLSIVASLVHEGVAVPAWQTGDRAAAVFSPAAIVLALPL